MQCLALWLMAPFSQGYVGPVLHAITGRWNVGDLIGNIFLIVAVITSFMGVAFRLADENEVRAMVFQRVLPAAEVAIALMLMFFWQSSWPKSAHPVPSLVMVPLGGEIWMRAYFVVLIAVVGYIGHMALRTLITLYRVAQARGRPSSCTSRPTPSRPSRRRCSSARMFVPAVRPLNPAGRSCGL